MTPCGSNHDRLADCIAAGHSPRSIVSGETTGESNEPSGLAAPNLSARIVPVNSMVEAAAAGLPPIQPLTFTHGGVDAAPNATDTQMCDALDHFRGRPKVQNSLRHLWRRDNPPQ